MKINLVTESQKTFTPEEAYKFPIIVSVYQGSVSFLYDSVNNAGDMGAAFIGFDSKIHSWTQGSKLDLLKRFARNPVCGSEFHGFMSLKDFCQEALVKGWKC